MAPLYPAPQTWPRYERIFSRQNVIGFAVGFIVATTTVFLFEKTPVEFTVSLNKDGVGQPRPLFDLAERADPDLKFNFVPAELRNVYVCEFKRVSGEDYTALALQYLDAYRDCFDVSVQGQNEFKISPNTRSASLQQKEGDTFLCRCNGLPD
jgi:hypothetical protein